MLQSTVLHYSLRLRQDRQMDDMSLLVLSIVSSCLLQTSKTFIISDVQDYEHLYKHISFTSVYLQVHITNSSFVAELTKIINQEKDGGN